MTILGDQLVFSPGVVPLPRRACARKILQLAEEGRVSLDDSIDDYVAGVPNGTRITLRQLITMTSGLGNYSDDEAWGLAVLGDLEAEWTPQQLLAYSYAMPPSFAAGSNMEYSNANFVLLGLVVEHVTGQAMRPS